jgi:hypothetical protein
MVQKRTNKRRRVYKRKTRVREHWLTVGWTKRRAQKQKKNGSKSKA